jgi:PleD family two-component response regulator
MSYGITQALSKDTIDTIIHRADLALYKAKKSQNKIEIIIDNNNC